MEKPDGALTINVEGTTGKGLVGSDSALDSMQMMSGPAVETRHTGRRVV